jgi:hypothetical protein
VFGVGLVLVKPLLCYVLSLWGQRNNLFRFRADLFSLAQARDPNQLWRPWTRMTKSWQWKLNAFRPVATLNGQDQGSRGPIPVKASGPLALLYPLPYSIANHQCHICHPVYVVIDDSHIVALCIVVIVVSLTRQVRDSQQQNIRENIQYFHLRQLFLSVIPL